jgi:hypothetical protein
MTADVARDLAAAGRVADVDRVLQVERLDKRRQIVGVVVEVIAVPRLVRAAVAAAVMRDTAVAALGQIKHLVLEGVRAQWPTMTEHDRLPRAPILVIYLSAVLSRDRAHVVCAFCRT